MFRLCWASASVTCSGREPAANGTSRSSGGVRASPTIPQCRVRPGSSRPRCPGCSPRTGPDSTWTATFVPDRLLLDLAAALLRSLTSTPPMNASPLIRTTGPPGTPWTCALSSKAPMNPKPLTITVMSSGTDDVDPAHDRDGGDGHLPLGERAWVRSRSTPPISARAVN